MLSDIPLFSELASQDLQLISAHGVTRTYPKNAILMSEGDWGDSLYLILTGKVKVFVSDETGKEVILNIQGPGEHFGELALVDPAPRSASVMTLEPCKVFIMAKADFQRCLTENPTIAFALLRVLARRVRSLTESVKNLALLDVYGRVAHTLLSLATERDDQLVIEQRLTHQDIANMVGASREMVSRIMKDLAIGGYILCKDRKIVIQKRLPSGW